MSVKHPWNIVLRIRLPCGGLQAAEAETTSALGVFKFVLNDQKRKDRPDSCRAVSRLLGLGVGHRAGAVFF